MKDELIRRLSVRGAQAQLARSLSVSATTVNNWANGRNIPEPEHWAGIEAALGMEPGSLAALVMPPGPGDPIAALRTELAMLGAELQHLRAEVDELRSERRQPATASARPRRAARSTPS